MSDNHATPGAIVHVPDASPSSVALHPFVQAAIGKDGIDTQTMRELMDMQKEWQADRAKQAFTRALVDLKRDLPTVIAKDTTVDFTSKKTGIRTYYKHASLAGMMDAITEPLTQHGFSLHFSPKVEERNVTVTCRLVHSEGHSEESVLQAPVDTSGNKSPAQGVASTITLLSRYAALSLLGIATKDMIEPTGEAKDPNEVINADLNLKAVGRLESYGVTREEAEEHLGKKVAKWTKGDLGKLKDWLAPKQEDASEATEENYDDVGPAPMAD